MGQFIYFAADGSRKPDLCGLTYAFPGNFSTSEMAGPNGLPGIFFSVDADAIRFDQEWETTGTQEWVEREDGKVWIGFNTSSPPTAAELAKPKQVTGRAMPLVEGGEWIVPRLRMYVAEHGFAVALPQRIRRSKGKWYDGEVLPEWREADQLAEELLDLLVQFDAECNPFGKMRMIDAAEYASRILAVNYRVTADELGAMGALPMDERLRDVLHFAIDYQAAEDDVLKKLEALAS
jgi:hypothetical protein